jgi:hypothetical protein
MDKIPYDIVIKTMMEMPIEMRYLEQDVLTVVKLTFSWMKILHLKPIITLY